MTGSSAEMHISYYSKFRELNSSFASFTLDLYQGNTGISAELPVILLTDFVGIQIILSYLNHISLWDKTPLQYG